MAGLMADGAVDVYFDSAYPALAVREQAGSRVILRRWKGGDPVYWGVLVARSDSDIESASGFEGGVVAFEEPFSTSGYLLQAGTLIQSGLNIRQVSGPEADVGPGEIGYFFSRDEKNTVALILDGRVAGAGLSNQDLAELPPDILAQLTVLERTIAVPRQLVSVRPGLDPALASQLQQLLANLHQTQEGRALLEGLKGTARFDLLPPDSLASLGEMVKLMALLGVGSR
jgi:phosphonate transport system substrate-binding protein